MPMIISGILFISHILKFIIKLDMGSVLVLLKVVEIIQNSLIEY